MMMVGENIQRFREQFQTVRGRFTMGQFGFGEKIAGRPLMKHLSTRMRGTGTGTSSASSKGLSNPGVYEEPPSDSYERFVSV
jgi:hypothetical protein